MFRFFNTTRQPFRAFVSNKNKTELSGSVSIYFWEPYPSTILGLRNKPILGFFSGGDAGHLSLGINYLDGRKCYISIWPKEIKEYVHGHDNYILIKPINNSESLEKDIVLERNRQPKTKIIEIDIHTENKLEKATRNIISECNKDFRDRVQWSITNNCATFVSDILFVRQALFTQNKP